MNRRELIKSGAVTAGVVAFGGLQSACTPKSLSFWVQSVVGALEEIAPLIPAQAANIKKIVAVAKDFDAKYQAGAFADALTIFQNMTSLIDDLVRDIGVNLTPQIKVALSVAGIAIRTIALLLKQQGESQPTIARAVRGGAQSQAISTVSRLADLNAIDVIYAASKP